MPNRPSIYRQKSIHRASYHTTFVVDDHSPDDFRLAMCTRHGECIYQDLTFDEFDDLIAFMQEARDAIYEKMNPENKLVCAAQPIVTEFIKWLQRAKPISESEVPIPSDLLSALCGAVEEYDNRDHDQ